MRRRVSERAECIRGHGAGVEEGLEVSNVGVGCWRVVRAGLETGRTSVIEVVDVQGADLRYRWEKFVLAAPAAEGGEGVSLCAHLCDLRLYGDMAMRQR